MYLREDLAAVDPWNPCPRETKGHCIDVDHDSCAVPTGSNMGSLGDSSSWVILDDTANGPHSNSLLLLSEQNTVEISPNFLFTYSESTSSNQQLGTAEFINYPVHGDGNSN